MTIPQRAATRRALYVLLAVLAGAAGCKKHHDDPASTSGGGPAPDTIATVATLTIAKTGGGTGLVRSAPEGLVCGENCSHVFDAGTAVTLTAEPADAGSEFAGWSGVCSGTGPCTVALHADATVTARFEKGTRQLAVAKEGNGAGTVTSAPDGLACGPTCAASFTIGSVIQLTAAPADDKSVFVGWSGACAGTGDCSVTLGADQAVAARFDKVKKTLTVAKSGGSGTVTSMPAGISCGTDCSAPFTVDSPVRLTAAPDDAFTAFAGWSGACAGTGSCNLVMEEAKTANAAFAPISLDGFYSGQNTQAKPIDFQVDSEKLRVVSGTVTAVGTYCTVSSVFTYSWPSGLAIAADHTFDFTSTTLLFHGAFSTPTQASGTLHYYNAYCDAAAELDWTASRVGGGMGGAGLRAGAPAGFSEIILSRDPPRR